MHLGEDLKSNIISIISGPFLDFYHLKAILSNDIVGFGPVVGAEVGPGQSIRDFHPNPRNMSINYIYVHTSCQVPGSPADSKEYGVPGPAKCKRRDCRLGVLRATRQLIASRVDMW